MININKHTRAAFRAVSLMLAVMLVLSPVSVSAADDRMRMASDTESVTVTPSALLSAWLEPRRDIFCGGEMA